MKRKKNMLWLLICLAVLVTAVLAVTKLTPDSSSTEPTEDHMISIFTLDTAAVEKLEWKYSEDLSFELTDDGWEYAGDAAFPLDESYIEQALSAISAVSATRTIEDVTDWDQYGLEVPICKISVTTDVTRTLSIGEETGLGGARYASIGDGNVYLVDASIIDPFRYGLYDLLAYEPIPAMSAVTGIALESDSQNYEIQYAAGSGKVYSDDYVWFMDGKVLDNELTEDLISDITAVSWGQCVEYNAADLSQYGLDAPAVTVTVHYTETVTTDDETQEQAASFTLEIGGEKDDQRYARIAGSNMVYLIDGDLCETLLYTTYQELRPDEVLLLNWEDLQSMDITMDGVTYSLRKYTRTVNSGTSGTVEETVYILGETELNADAVLTALDDLTVTGYAADTEPEFEQEIKIVFHREHAYFPQVELVFYPYDSAQCLTTLNGEATVFVSREDVADLVEEITQLVLGET